ncbi:MAG: hypothetical protein ABWK05_04200 [Pyrobaculum sp.]
MRSLEVVVLFVFVSAASVFLAFYVDLVAQQVLDDEVKSVAMSAANSLAAQLRDVFTAASYPFVRSFTYRLYFPTSFPTLDAYDYVAEFKNVRGVLYVNLTFWGYRGAGRSFYVHSVAVVNASEVAAVYGKCVYIDGARVDLPGYKALYKPRQRPLDVVVARCG